MDFLYLFIGRGYSRANRPDGFIRDDELVVIDVDSFKLGEIVLQSGFQTLVFYLQRLADAVEYFVSECFIKSVFLSDQLLGFAYDVAAFAVPYEDGVNIKLRKLHRSHLAGERAFFLKISVLRADGHFRSAIILKRAKRGESVGFMGDIIFGNKAIYVLYKLSRTGSCVVELEV